MSLLDFYKEKFDSDPYKIMDYAYHEIANLAAFAGIDWPAIADKIVLSQTKGHSERFSSYSKAPKALEKKLKGRVEVYSRVETSRDGIEYPFINFVQKGSDAGSWSGLQFLFNEYNYCKNNETTVSSNKNNNQLAKIRAEREERLRLAKLDELKKSEENKKKYEVFLKAFNSASAEDGSFNYVVKKQISAIFNNCNIKSFSEWDHGPKLMAIPLSKINSPKISGWQRIYDDGRKTLTTAITAGDYIGACHVVGSLRSAKKIVLAEGFATAATAYLAANGKFDAAIMCISANNLLHVVDQIVELYPWIEIVVALDNDYLKAKKGKGNTGIKYGFEILKKHPKVKCIYPRFEEFIDEDDCSDFNDIWIKKGKRETSKQIFSNNNKLSIQGDYFKTELKILSVTPTENKKAFIKQLYACCDAGMKKCPVDYSPKELIKVINGYLNHLKVLKIYEGTVRSRIGKQFLKAKIKAQAPRSFSTKITDPTLRPDNITYTRYNTPFINEKILNHIKSLNGPVIVRAGMGSGKSKFLLKPLMNSSQSGISLAHRVSLTSSLYDMMTDGQRSKSDIFNYQEQGINDIASGVQKLILCINSIIKGSWTPLVREHGFLGFDEATQGLRAICTSRVVQYPVDVFNRLILAIASSREHSVLVDADANDTLIELCEMAIKKREEIGLEPWTQIHVIELPVDVSYTDKNGNKKQREVFYTDSDRVFSEILESAKNNETFLVATDNKNKADQLLNELKTNHPSKKFLYVSQDTTPTPEVMEFTDSPSKTAKKYDGLIYSPAISSGVSIEVEHFKKHYGIFSGVVVPSDAIQMLRRDRTAVEFMIGFDKISGQHSETAENIRKGFIQAMIATGEINQEYCDAIFENDKLSLGLADTPFTKMKMKIMEMEASSRSNFSNNLIYILDADGYKVHHLASNEEKSTLGKNIRKDAKKRVQEIELMRYLEAQTPDDKTRTKLLEKRTLTEEEKAMITRYEIEHELGLDVNEESIDFWLSGGKNKIKMVEIRDMSHDEAASIDKEEQEFMFIYKYKLNGISDYMVVNSLSQDAADKIFKKAHPFVDSLSVQSKPVVDILSRTFASLHRKLLRRYFDDCGINIKTGEGDVTTEAMQKAMDNLIDIERLEMFNNVIRFGGYTGTKNKPKRADTVFKAICKSHGYKINKRRLPRSQGRGYVWFIDSESWQFISSITDNRKKMNKSTSAKNNQNLKTEHEVIPDLISIYNNKNKIEDQKDLKWANILSAALEDLPISKDWVEEVLTDVERDFFIDDDLPVWALTNTIIGIYMSEFLGDISQDHLEIFKNRMRAA
ncbi:plasmid replication protein, CyRepA1 family (plasmid) [Orbus sturtevantii]|uniref:plasmid replication protein, CyRepA1 family n=1 Tax=Orbus sturtevantii TaxID=3074109 RepID=UPI00370D8909